jgi:DNA-binding transcriptional ArsR family regulator
MLTVTLTASDIAALRFAVSPLTEAAQSLVRLASARIDPPYRGWLDRVRPRLDGASVRALADAVSLRADAITALCGGPSGLATTIQAQLALLDETAPGSARPLADQLAQFWALALEPHWRTMRAVLQEDVAFRATEQTRHGAAAMVRGLHPALDLTDGVLRVATARAAPVPPGVGLVLVPSVFTGPDPSLETGYDGRRHLRYPARGVARLWSPRPTVSDDGSLAALLGRRRAAILSCLDVPRSTSELAVRLGQTAPSVSQHLSVLRRSGLVTSWRSGRWVLYRRTGLASDLVGANDPEAVGEA